MNMTHKISICILIGAVILSACRVNEPATKQPDEAASSPKQLPLDPAVRTGTLENGFTYYIRRNTEPKDRAQLYLVNKVGSILEDEDQRGLAHFLEHMNFNGTTHFPKNELVDYLEKAGVKFGADLNAYTNFDETVYQLPIPVDDPDVLKTGMLIMHDWAQEALLETEEIDKERGVILEEKRVGQGAGQRMRNQYLPKLLNNSRYARRLPIGTEAVLTRFAPEALRAFHNDWYRPDLQALVVVGDIDVKEMEKKIRLLFADLEMPENPKKREEYTVPLTGRNQVVAVTDKEMPATVAQVIMKHPGEPLKTRQDFRRAMIRSLYNTMTNARMEELARQSDPPFLGARIQMGGFLADLQAHTSFIRANPGELERGFRALMAEVERIDRYGFTETELERAKKSYLAAYRSAVQEKDKNHSKNLVEQYVRNFLEGEAAPGIEYEFKLVNRLLPEITVQDINRSADQWISHKNRDIIIMAPEKEKDTLPDEAAIQGWISGVRDSTIAPYEDYVSNELLVDPARLSPPGNIVSRKERPEIGVTEVRLSNGVTVLLKPTEFKNDQVLFRAFSPGGSSLYNNNDYFSAAFAAGIIGNSGVGPFDKTALNKYMSGKRARVSPYIGERTEGMQGASTPKDLGTMMQLIYQYFNAPNKDEEVFRGIMARQRGRLANRADNPAQVFADTVAAVLSNNNIRRTAMTENKLNRVDLDTSYRIYKERFENADDFTFVIVGSFTEEEILPLISKYLGALPGTGREEQPKDLDIHIPEGTISTTIYEGIADKATVRLVFSGPYHYSRENNMQLDALAEIMQIRLTERLRESEGGTYSPGVYASYSKYPDSRYSFTIAFDCAPGNMEKLIAATRQEIDKLKSSGPDSVNIQKFVAEEKSDWETNLRNNGFWLGYLAGQYQNNEDPGDILSYDSLLQTLAPEGLRRAAREYLGGENYIRLVRLPERAEAENGR